MKHEPTTSRTTERIVFGMECQSSADRTRSYISIHMQGDWDMDLLESVVEFVQRQRHRLTQQRGPLLCDGWESETA